MNTQTNQESQPAPPTPQTVRVALPRVVPYVTYTLIGITACVYLLQFLSQALLGEDLLFILGVKYGPFIREGQVWRLITPVFLHASVWHIGFNLLALYSFGRGLEPRFGHLRFLALYFLSAIAGNVFSFVLTPAASLGASTATFGLLTAEGIFLFQNRQLLGERANRAIVSILSTAGINLLFGFTTPGIDNWGHIGGLLGGLLFAWFGGPRWRLEGLPPSVTLVDERQANGLWAGSAAVLLVFLPLAAIGWFLPQWLP